MLEIVIEETLYNSDIIIEETIETTTIVIDEAGVVVVPISEDADNQAERRVDGLYVPLPYRTPVEQSKGDSEEVVMSQKAVTGELDLLASLASNKVDKVVGSGLIPLSKIAKLDGVADEATKNSPDAHLLDRVNHTGEQPISTITSLESELDAKVDKVVGFELSSNDFTDAEKSKLSSIATEATKNQGDTFLLSRVNHTGEQPISSVTNLETSLLNKVNRVTGKQLSTNDFTDALKIKLDLMAADATKNQSDSFLLNRENHYGTQTINSIENLIPTLNTKVDKVAGKVLSDNNFTTTEKDKLAGLEGSRFRGVFTSLAELQSWVVSPQAGYYAQVDTGLGSDAIQYIYDVSDDKWIAQESATPITSSQVKQMYESNPDTNAFTDVMKDIVEGVPNALSLKVDVVEGLGLSEASYTVTEKGKLRDIESGAQVNSVTSVSGKVGDISLSRSDVGLGDVDNTRDADKPISSAQQAALDGKVDKVVGKQLSDENYTTVEKVKLNLVQPEATKNSTDAQLRDRTTHTGFQPISSISNLQTELDSKLTKPTDGKLYGVRNGVFVPIMAGSTA